MRRPPRDPGSTAPLQERPRFLPTPFANVQKLRQVFPDLSARATFCDDADPATIRQGLAAVGFTTHSLTRASPVILAAARLGHFHDYRAGKVNDYHRAVVDNLPVCRSAGLPGMLGALFVWWGLFL